MCVCPLSHCLADTEIKECPHHLCLENWSRLLCSFWFMNTAETRGEFHREQRVILGFYEEVDSIGGVSIPGIRAVALWLHMWP